MFQANANLYFAWILFILHRKRMPESQMARKLPSWEMVEAGAAQTV